jgi:hypothetical protein
MPEVPRQPDQAKTRIRSRCLDHHLVGTVAAAVVDQDHLRIRIELIQHFDKPGDQLVDHPLLVVCGDYQ